VAEQKEAPAGDEAVKRATGRDWSEWGKILDREGAKTMNHGEIVAIVGGKYGVGSWWCQMVTVGYERSRGLRAVHQKADGFSASISRVIAAPPAEVYALFEDTRLRRKWLGAPKMTVRKAIPNKSMRITWADGSSVQIVFDAHGEGKSRVTVEHSKLAAQGDVAERKAFWSAAIAKLKAQLGV
jgi:uncharacterized protein YndB with AHSA1/START domain